MPRKLSSEKESRALPVEKMVAVEDLKHIQMTEVPKAYFTTVKQRHGRKMSYYDNLIQITILNNGIIFDLETLHEVDSIEQVDKMQIPDRMINTGFIMSSSRSIVEEEYEFVRRT